MNKFYQFKEPYYALIAAPTAERAIEIYHDEICEACEEETAPKEITLEDARAQWNSRENKQDDPEEVESYLEIENGCAMLVDGYLM